VSLFCGVIEGVKVADFVDPPSPVEGIEKAGVAFGEGTGFEVATTEIVIGVSVGILSGKEMEAEPAPIHRGYFLGFAEEPDEEEEDEIGIDRGLEFEITSVVFAGDLIDPALELEGGVEGMIDFFDEGDQGKDIGIAKSFSGVMAFQLIDQPAGVVDADMELAVGPAEESAGEFTEFAGGGPGGATELARALRVDEAVFEVDPDLGVGPFEKLLNLAEKSGVHERKVRSLGGAESRWTRESAS
jgi:hypothetical protein